MNIKQILANEGVVWASRMDCPRCKSEHKVTASESKGIAKCWKCNASWSDKAGGPKHTWANTLVRGIAERCQAHLENSMPAFTWLVEKRVLPSCADWLRTHQLGAIPKDLDAAGFSAQALENLRAEREAALETCEDEKSTKKMVADYDAEERRLQTFTETLMKLDDKMWIDAVVYVYDDACGQPISLNVRQQKLEAGGGEKHCFRVQPKIGQRGLFCPVDVAGDNWSGELPTLIVEGEHNWLSLLRRAEEWDPGWELAGFAVGRKNGADRSAAREHLQARSRLSSTTTILSTSVLSVLLGGIW